MRWPKMHIAASVQNRILNAAEGIAAPAVLAVPPTIPPAAAQGAALDQALNTPVQAVPAPAESGEAIAANAVAGETAADAVGGLAAIEAL